MVAILARFSQSIAKIVVASSRHTNQRGLPALRHKHHWAAPPRDKFGKRHAPREAQTALPQQLLPETPVPEAPKAFKTPKGPKTFKAPKAPKAPKGLSQLAPALQPQVKVAGDKPFKGHASHKSHTNKHATSKKPRQLNPYDFIPKQGSRGLWDGPAGDSGWHSAVPAMLNLTWGKPVQYRGGYPDFAPWAKATLTFEPNELRGKKDGTTADTRWAQGLGVEPQAARTRRQQERLDWHHVEDGRTMQLLPIPIHHNCAHTGGASVLRRSQIPGVTQQPGKDFGWAWNRLRHLMSSLGGDS